LDINFSYEDGLRLSELQGSLARLNEYASQADARIMTYAMIAIAVGILCVVCAVLAFRYIDYYDGVGVCMLSGALVFFVIVVLMIVLMVGVWWDVTYSIPVESSGIQAQIDALYSKYGLV